MLTVYCQPFILVFAFGKLHHLAQTATAQRGLCILSKLVACGAALASDPGPELVARTCVAVMMVSERQKRRTYCPNSRGEPILTP